MEFVPANAGAKYDKCIPCPQVKFNQALADHSMSDRPRLIDGIVLTKFDTIDDKVLQLFCFFFSPVLQTSMKGICRLTLFVCCGVVSLAGRRRHLDDVHHGPAHRVCGHRADVQRPAQPERSCCGQRPDESLSGCMLCCICVLIPTALTGLLAATLLI